MSDKRLLKRCGDGRYFLTEVEAVPVRPPGLRIRRAGALTDGPGVRDVRKIDESGNVLSEIESEGIR